MTARVAQRKPLRSPLPRQIMIALGAVDYAASESMLLRITSTEAYRVTRRANHVAYLRSALRTLEKKGEIVRCEDGRWRLA